MIYFWTIALAVVVTAVLSAAEMAFIAANRVRIRHLAETGDATAARCSQPVGGIAAPIFVASSIESASTIGLIES